MLRTLHLHSLKFVISSETLELDPVLDALYVDNELSGDVLPSVPRSEIAFRVEIGNPRSVAAVQDRPRAVFAENNLCGGPCYFADGQFGARLDGAYPQLIEYSPAAGALSTVLGDRFARDPLAVVGRVLRPLLQSFILPFHGLKSLHGAVVARDGCGIFLAGAGGAGKTTTALAFARHGWTILSDDGPLFAMDDEGAVALSSLDYLHATDRTLALFPELQRLVVGGRDHREKYAVALGASGDVGSLRRPVVVDRYIELRRTHVGRPHMAEIARSAVLHNLVAEAMTVFRGAPFRDPAFAAYSRWCLALIASFTTRVRPFFIEYGDDHLNDIPELVEAHG